MLGTLVALAVARMVNLETFVWDMPTGVLRDVWLALSSLQNRHPKNECRLERVWVRWHDNSDSASLPPAQASSTPASTTPQMLAGSTMTNIGWTIPPGSTSNTQGNPQPLSYAQSRVEYPTLSVLPPLRSLSVLDVDELDYLDEMSVLIAKSKDRLRELRVGISAKAVNRDFVIAWDGPELHQVDHKASWPGASTSGERRLGGVLGVLLGRVFDIRKKQKAKPDRKDWDATTISSPLAPQPPNTQILLGSAPTQSSDVLLNHIPETPEINTSEEYWTGKGNGPLNETVLSDPGTTFNPHTGPTAMHAEGLNPNHQQDMTTTDAESTQSNVQSLSSLVAQSIAALQLDDVSQLDVVAEPPLRRSSTQTQRQSHFSEAQSIERERLDGKLRLQSLELERVPLSVEVLRKAFDWSVLSNLTILDCAQHDRLWHMLRRHFQPSPLGPASSSKHGVSLQYHLNLKKVHTDAASPALITFLKETLAPNTLETLFLQDRKRTSTTSVTIVRAPSSLYNSHVSRMLTVPAPGCYISWTSEAPPCKSEEIDARQLRQDTKRTYKFLG